MSIIVSNENGVSNYIFSHYDDHEFVLQNNSGEDIVVESPLLLDTSYDDKEFEVYFLAKKNIKENDIFQVYYAHTGNRIGWIFPVISLASRDHDFVDNSHYLRYAYVAAREILDSQCKDIYTKNILTNTSRIQFTDVFHEDTVLLVISSETMEADTKFNIDRVSPSLIKYGYIKLSKQNPDNIKLVADVPESKKLHIHNVSDHIDYCDIICTILNTLLAYENNVLLKFFYIYQIIEILIENIYSNEQEILVDHIIAAKGDSGKTKEILGDIRIFMSDSNRISKLVNEYTHTSGSFNVLMSQCNSLLRQLGRKESAEFNRYFYSVRNFIFHQFRDFPESCKITLNTVINEFINVLPEILAKYKKPGI